MNDNARTTGRRLSPLDQLLARADNALRTLTPGATRGERPSPADAAHSDSRPVDVATGPPKSGRNGKKPNRQRFAPAREVCAQALYQGQASTAGLPHVRRAMEEAAREEEDHLAWCEDRIRELGSVPSRLNPLFYAMSFSIGALAGLAGDRWSLGFVSETEQQVVRHLDSHLGQVPLEDERTRAILEQMREDELRHAVTAEQAGGAALPPPVRHLMTVMSKVMTFSTYRV